MSSVSAQLPVRLSVLIPTVACRRWGVERLLSLFRQELSKAEGDEVPLSSKDVEIIVFEDNLELPISNKRDILRQLCRGEFLCFVDDDDVISFGYLHDIVKLIKENSDPEVDYIGWWQKYCAQNNELNARVLHSLKCEKWQAVTAADGTVTHERHVSHLNPVRKSRAMLQTFGEHVRNGEDQKWDERIRPYLRKELFLDQVMYLYFFNENLSLSIHPIPRKVLEENLSLSKNVSKTKLLSLFHYPAFRFFEFDPTAPNQSKPMSESTWLNFSKLPDLNYFNHTNNKAAVSLHESKCSSFSADEWIKMPIDDRGYFSFQEIVQWPAAQCKSIFEQFRATRNNTNGWRNEKGLWRQTLTDGVHHKTILDYGSGFGIETLEFCLNQNQVFIADIHEQNTAAACHVLGMFGYKPKGVLNLQFESPFIKTPVHPAFTPGCLDLFYSNGVLHHSPHLKNILREILPYLKPISGEIRLMLYSDKAWIKHTGNTGPLDYETPIYLQAGFEKFTGAMDSVGVYADWYNQEKMQRLVANFLTITFFSYICKDDIYCVFHMKPLAQT